MKRRERSGSGSRSAARAHTQTNAVFLWVVVGGWVGGWGRRCAPFARKKKMGRAYRYSPTSRAPPPTSTTLQKKKKLRFGFPLHVGFGAARRGRARAPAGGVPGPPAASPRIRSDHIVQTLHSPTQITNLNDARAEDARGTPLPSRYDACSGFGRPVESGVRRDHTVCSGSDARSNRGCVAARAVAFSACPLPGRQRDVRAEVRRRCVQFEPKFIRPRLLRFCSI